jgi:hypothetical protein
MIIIFLDNAPYTALDRKAEYNPYSNLAGLRPYSREQLSTTSTRAFNKEMENIFKNQESKDLFYKSVRGI